MSTHKHRKEFSTAIILTQITNKAGRKKNGAAANILYIYIKC